MIENAAMNFFLFYLLIGFFIAVMIIMKAKKLGQLDALHYLFWAKEGEDIPHWFLIIIIMANIIIFWPLYALDL